MVVSAVWTALVIIGVFYSLQDIKRTSENAAQADARETRLGEATVGIAFVGYAAVWGLAWSRHRRRVT